LGSFLWALWSALREGWSNLRKLHQIPCSRCAFFTGDYHLKCTVHPCKALSEEAINCLDYESISTPRPYAPLCRWSVREFVLRPWTVKLKPWSKYTGWKSIHERSLYRIVS
jgi:hypothetical protein